MNDSPQTWAIRRRATDALIARRGEAEIRMNIYSEMQSQRLLTDDPSENDRLVDEVFEKAKYWVNPSAYEGRP